MTSNAALTREARAHLENYRRTIHSAKGFENAVDSREIGWRAQHEAWAAREIVSAVRAITLRHRDAGTTTSMALQADIILAFSELVEYAKANRAVHILDILQNNVYTSSETLEIARAEMVSADETPAIDPKTLETNAALVWAAAPDCGETHDDGNACQIVHFARPAGDRAVEVYTCHGVRVVKLSDLRKVRDTERTPVPHGPYIAIDSDLIDETPAPATEEDGDGMSWERDLDDAPKVDVHGGTGVPACIRDTGAICGPCLDAMNARTDAEDDAPKHWDYNAILEAAVYDPSTECKRTTVTLREGDTAVAMGTTKYEHYGPGVIDYYIRPDGMNARTDCPVRHIRK